MFGDEPEDRRASEDSGVAHRGDAGDGEVDGHLGLASDGGEEDGDEVGGSDADEGETENSSVFGRGVSGEGESGGGGEGSGDDDFDGAKGGDDAITGEASYRHGEGEGDVADSGFVGVEEVEVGEGDAGPVEDGAFGEEDEEAKDAEEGDFSLREGEGRGGLFASEGEEAGAGKDQAGEDEGDEDEDRGGELESGVEEEGESAGTKDSADAVEPVEAGHEGFGALFFDEDGLDVHDDIGGADGGSEDEEEEPYDWLGGEEGDEREGEGTEGSGDEDGFSATVAGGPASGEGHSDEGAGADAEEEKAELGIVEAVLGFEEGDEGGDGRHE